MLSIPSRKADDRAATALPFCPLNGVQVIGNEAFESDEDRHAPALRHQVEQSCIFSDGDVRFNEIFDTQRDYGLQKLIRFLPVHEHIVVVEYNLAISRDAQKRLHLSDDLPDGLRPERSTENLGRRAKGTIERASSRGLKREKRVGVCIHELVSGNWGTSQIQGVRGAIEWARSSSAECSEVRARRILLRG